MEIATGIMKRNRQFKDSLDVTPKVNPYYNPGSALRNNFSSTTTPKPSHEQKSQSPVAQNNEKRMAQTLYGLSSAAGAF